MGLGVDAAGHQRAGFGIQGDLAAGIDDIADPDGLGIRADGGGGKRGEGAKDTFLAGFGVEIG